MAIRLMEIFSRKRSVEEAVSAFGRGMKSGDMTGAMEATNRLVAAASRYWDQGGSMDRKWIIHELLRQYRGWVYACAQRNANSVAAAKVRLYAERQAPAGERMLRLKLPNGAERRVPRRTIDLYKQNQSLGRYIKSGTSVEEITSHPMLDLLRSVNAFESTWDLLHGTCTWQDITGNCYWWLVPSRILSQASRYRGAPIPAEIWILAADRVKVIPAPLPEFVRGYEYTPPGTGAMDLLPLNEVIHFKYPNPRNPYYGASPLEAASWAVDIDEQRKRYVYSLFKNYAIPPVVFKLPFDVTSMRGPTIDDKKWQKFKARWKELHAGPDNAGKLALLQGGLELQQVGFTPREIWSLMAEKPTVDELAAVWGVPIYLLTGEGSDRNNAEAADYNYQRNTVTPRVIQIEEKLNERLAPLYDDRLFCAFECVVPADRRYELDEHKALVDIIMTKNEARIARGLDPVKGGDQLYVPPGYTPLGAVGAAPPGGGNGEEDLDAEKRGGQQKKSAGGSAQTLRAASLVAAIARAEAEGKTVREGGWIKARGDLASKCDAAVNAAVTDWFRDIMEDIQARIEAEPDGTPATWTAGAGAIAKAKADKAVKPLESAFADAGQTAMNCLSLSISRSHPKPKEEAGQGKATVSALVWSFSTTNPGAQRRISKLRDNFSVYWDRYMDLPGLRNDLANSIAAGATSQAMKQDVAKHMGFLSRDAEGNVFVHPEESYKATRIARTETIRALNYGALEGWKQSEIVVEKMWINGPDPCEFCQQFAGKTWTIGDTVADNGDVLEEPGGGKLVCDYGDVEAPPLHSRCVCDIVPLTTTEKERQTPGVREL
jgi:hypothetical protein